MKRITTILLAMVMMLLLSAPAMAAQTSTNDFANFPTTGPQYSGTYKAQTVAVQRFLMSQSASDALKISNSGGTDGLFGATTTEMIKTFQGNNGLSADGIVGSATWRKIGSLLTEVGVDSVGPVLYYNGKDILVIGPDSYGVGYMAVTDKGKATSIFYYTSKN